MYFAFSKTLSPEFQHLRQALFTGEDMHALACSFSIRNGAPGLELHFGFQRPEPYLTEAIRKEKSELSHFLINLWSDDFWRLDAAKLDIFLLQHAEQDPQTGIWYAYAETDLAVYTLMIRIGESEFCVVRCYNRYFAAQTQYCAPVRMTEGKLQFVMELSAEEASIVHTALLALAAKFPTTQRNDIRMLDKRLLDGWKTFQNGIASDTPQPQRNDFSVIQSYSVPHKEDPNGQIK